MTADGPDKGTPEYKAAYTTDTFTGARFYYRSFLQHLTKEERKKFVSQLGDYNKMNTAPFQQFAELTGPLPKKSRERQKLLKEVHELTKTGYYPYLITYLQSMQEHARYSNLVDAYNKGDIRPPELLAILEEEAPFPEEYQFLPEAAILQKMLEAGKLDFEPFRHERDIEENWYNFYRIAFQPLPVIRRSIRRIADTNEFNYRGTIEHLKTQVKILLEGERPTPEMLERTGGEGADTYVIPPVEPEKLISFAELIEGQYQTQVKEKTALDFNAPFTQAIDTGFYINPGTSKVTDLRPYQKELHALLSLKSWDYLKDFANAIREAVKEFTEPVKPGPLSVTAKKTRSLIHAIDKVDENLFAGMFDEKASNQPALFHTVTIDKGKQKGKKINVTAYIDFDKLPEEIKKELTDYDRRVCEASAAIFNAGNEVTTLTQLYYTMGGTGKPAKNQIEKINQSVTKMMGTLFHIDNQDETANNINYPKIEYDGPLLPCERITATVNGKVTDAAIHLFREPPLMTFARERKQIFTCSVELLQSPLNISETKLAIEHCLLSLLAMGKHETEKEKRKPEQHRKPVKKEMLLETIYKRAKTTDRRTKPRTKEKIITLLTHYKSKGQIKDFKLTNDRVILEF